MKYLVVFVAYLAVACAVNYGVVNVDKDNSGYQIEYDFTKAYRSERYANDGSVQGVYSYIDDLGLEHHVNFQAGPAVNNPGPLLRSFDAPARATQFYRRASDPLYIVE